MWYPYDFSLSLFYFRAVNLLEPSLISLYSSLFFYLNDETLINAAVWEWEKLQMPPGDVLYLATTTTSSLFFFY